jgi:hypothetical protein
MSEDAETDANVVQGDIVHFASAQDIFDVDDTLYENVEVPEWRRADGSPFVVRLRGLTGAERDSWEGTVTYFDSQGRQKVNTTDMRARLIVRSAVDGDGKRLFGGDAVARQLSKKSAAGLQRLFEVAQRLSGLTREDIDEMTKNSDGAQTEASQNGAAGSDTAFSTASR